MKKALRHSGCEALGQNSHQTGVKSTHAELLFNWLCIVDSRNSFVILLHIVIAKRRSLLIRIMFYRTSLLIDLQHQIVKAKKLLWIRKYYRTALKGALLFSFYIILGPPFFQPQSIKPVVKCKLTQLKVIFNINLNIIRNYFCQDRIQRWLNRKNNARWVVCH